ncbi:alpha-L-fucosidase [[Ruminococcus] gnavus]|uniref:alpha-L-fucosidase n=1 Tax=Mediterraneibacter gnavus TaxID=33038 RepID=A0A9Q4HUD4_MEDGN|nr:alpha-L-fucosidase [Mediterraneibacter gnavus]MCZ0667249.1 alpha-L-fucosidase [Mediterraneibacter gnavus]
MKKKALYKKWMSMLLAGVVTTTGFMGGTVTLRAAETTNWIGDENLTGNAEAPAKDDVVPDKNQFRYQKEELAAFCHFGPNTFNEIEWGEHYGNQKPSEIFTLKNDFDAETLVKTLKDAGFKKLIVTAKHHDGFCIWDSEHTEYDVAASGYKDANGQSDILAEISKACTDQNMDMGLYLSPWDIHDESYGYYDENHKPTDKEHDHLDYNEYYDNQLKEILGNEKYGNKGHFVEVWMDGAKGNGANAQEYDFKRWFNTIQENEGIKAGYDADCMLFGAEAYTTVRWIGNELGIAGKDTWSKSTVDKEKNTINSNKQGNATVGFEDGNQWTVPEADARITSGWFWGTKKNTPKTMDELSDMYFNSVGHNATLLLNIPPNNQGTVDKAILDRVTEFGNNIKETFKTNLAKAEGASVKVSEVRGNDETFKPGNMIDDNDETYWTTSDGNKSGEILVDLGEKKNFDVVSIEEAIQNGQRINKYKVEYREGDSGEWTLLEEGQTIGAKRLCRTSEVSAKQIKITVETKDGKVPMISEVGVYKSTEDMEKPNPIPKGMEVIDVTDKNVEDGKGFTFKGTWHDENQPQYINGTNTWANAGAELELKFHGTKAYFFGTVDPNHGKAEITIDGGDPITVDTKASKRAVGQRWFETPDLQDGDHTIKLKVSSQAIGIEAAAVINNGGKGMIELESDSYTMNEDETKDLKVKRVGGTEGKITAKLQPNPGTAIQDDYNTELNPVITLEPGQKETTAQVQTKRNKNKTGDQYFTAEITDVSEGAILGFNKKAKINIKDMESSEGSLAALVKECESYKKDWFTSGWDEFESALKQAKVVLEDKNATPEKRNEAEVALKKAKEGLVKREKYTAEDPFAFPWRKNSSAILEAEFAELHNTGENEKWPLKVSDADWASNKKFVNSLENEDTITIPYHVEKPGIYHAVVTYRSGSETNRFSWSDDAGNIQTGSVSAGNKDSNVTKTAEFDITVTKAGSGVLTLKGDAKAPQLDKFEITPKDVKLSEFTVNASIEGEGGTITPSGETKVTEGENVEFKITPDKTHKVADVLVDGESVGAVTSYTLKDVKKDATIVAKFAPASYTEENRFNFPTEVNGTAITAEAEHFELKNTGAEDEKWKLEVKDADWASNGYFVNSMNSGDTITLPYHAEKPGKYKATVQFRSGDANNGLTWAEKDNKIAAQTEVVKVGASDGAKETHTQEIEFVVNEAGNGTLVFTAPEKNAPQLDKFDIQFVEEKVPVVVDKDALKATIETAKEALKEADKYTEESVKALEAAVAEAEKVVADENATQESVDAATTAVEEATRGLAEKPAPEVNKDALKTAIETAKEALKEADKYTEESVKALEAAVAEAEKVVADENATQESVDAATTAVEEATRGLAEKPAVPEVNKDALKAAIEKAEDVLENLEEDAYTPESVEALKGALETAKGVFDNADAVQAEVDQAAEAIETAISGLTVKPAPEADKTALKAALAEAAQKLENAESFTEESVNALKEAMDLAQSVLDNPEANQAEADAATTAVRTAIENLQEKPPVQKEFTITAVAHGGGTIDPSGAVKVEEGKDQVFTIQPYEGFEVKEVFVNGESVGAVTEYKFEAVRADASIEVFFAEKEAVQADKTKLNESIAAAEELLKHAEDYVPEDVQNLMEVLDAAKAVAADPAVTQETVDAAQNALDAAMNIAPIQKEFAIMAAAGEGGSITPCGTVKVERGMSQTFAIQPKEGYVISDVLVNGQSVGAVAEYTFCDVNADANITALFQKAAVSTDKSQLTAVIKEAEERLEQADKYTEETVKALQKEVEAAQFILADKEASQADIDAAVQKVRTAIDALEEKAQTEKPENPDNNKPDNKPDNKPGNGNNGGQNNNGNNNQSSTQKPSAGTPNKAVKTGDATPIAGAVSGLLAGGAALLAFLKRRR